MGCGQSSNEANTAINPSSPKPTNATEKSVNKSNVVTTKTKSEPEVINYQKIHSAIRWNKPLDTIEELLVSADAANIMDESNGNRPIHIASQNGHDKIVRLLIQKGATINPQNMKGNTPLHMAIGYDYYDTAVLLIEAGADLNMINSAGFEANKGIDGDKTLGLAALICAKTEDELRNALDLCDKNIDLLQKASFVCAGLKTKKAIGSNWTTEQGDRFKNICSRL